MSRASINIKQAKEIISFTIQNNLKQPILLLGAPGIGKSEIMQEIGNELGYYVEDLRLAQMSETEIGGLIFPNEDKTKTHWLKPDYFPEENGPKTILFLDELTSASKRVQVAAYQLVLDRKIGKHKLPDSTIIVAAGNREEDDGVYVELAAPLANRFEIYDVECNANIWLEYARSYIDENTGKGINPLVTSYITSHPDQLHTQSENQDEMIFATPRSWKRVSDTLNAVNSNLSSVVENKICGTIGDDLGSKFILYCKHYASNTAAQDIIAGKEVTLGNERGDILYVTDSLVSILNSEFKTGTSLDECVDIYNSIVKFAGTLDGDYSQMLIAAASNVDNSITSAAMQRDSSITQTSIDSVGAILNDEDYTIEADEDVAQVLDGDMGAMEVFF